MMHQTDEYISLKEAAALSGYSSDYVGQLIRSGKLPGKQIYTNVSWVTTREALEDYISGRSRPHNQTTLLLARFFSPIQIARIYTATLWVGVALMSVVALFLVYVLFVSIDRQIEKTYAEEAVRVIEL